MARHYTMHTGLLGPVTQSVAPCLIEGVRQRAGETMPAACPHCHADPPVWVATYWVGHCMCGTTWFRTQYRMAKPRSKRSGNHSPVPLPNMREFKEDADESSGL